LLFQEVCMAFVLNQLPPAADLETKAILKKAAVAHRYLAELQTNTIESPFATVRLRTDKTRGQGTEKTTHMMVFKLLEQASLRWHKLAGSNIIPMVLAGAIFKDGELKKAA